jgi:DNA replication ATP-dependent helicase Dna2
MIILNALFLNRINGELELYNPQNRNQFKLGLIKPWIYFPFSKISYLTHLRIINPFQLSKEEYETTPDTLIVINPDILISARMIANAQICPRQSYLMFIQGESKPTLPMIRGLIIHDAFSLIISNKTSVKNAIERTFDNYSFELSYLKADIDNLKNEVIPVVNGLAKSAITLQDDQVIPELTFLSPMYGLSGRIDFWAKDELYELKTGKKIPSQEINTWRSDLYQTLVYMHGLSATPNKAVKKAFVIYSGKGNPAFRRTEMNIKFLQEIHIARNHCYLFQYEDYQPQMREINACKYCFVKDLCVQFQQIEASKTTTKGVPYFRHFSSLLRMEHLKNRRDFSLLWKLSKQGRIKLGKAINNLKLRKWEGETYTYSCKNNSELKPGEPVILSHGNAIADNTMLATIQSIDQNSVNVRSYNPIPRSSFLDAYSSDFNYRRLNKNVYDLSLGEKSSHKVHNLIIGGCKPQFSKVEPIVVDGLDESQLSAIQKAIEAKDFCLIQGPAGTGKTYTIAKLIEELRRRNQTILLTAYTNTAVDNIILECYKTGALELNQNLVIRLGIEEVVHPEVKRLTAEIHTLTYQKLANTPIIAVTTTTISKSIYDQLVFDVVIVDEATQMAEPHLLSAIAKGKKFILVGDDKQLPPLVQSSQAAERGLNVSLFERLKNKHPHANVLLRFQYRMNDILMEYSNLKYYSGKVKAASKDIGNQLLWDILPSKPDLSSRDQLIQVIINPDQPLVYVGVETEFDRKRRINNGEADIIQRIVQAFIDIGVSSYDIGIIAPFRGQVAEISRELFTYPEVIIDTIDRFQGSDKEIIILSLCTLHSPNLLEDNRRLNVALTRAKKKMIIVGNKPTEEAIPQFRDLYQFIDTNYSIVFLEPEKIKQADRQFKKVKTKKIELAFSSSHLDERDLNNTFSTPIDHNICVICLEEVKKEESVLQCPICKQIYHAEHLEEWLMTHESCVTCQTTIHIS